MRTLTTTEALVYIQVQTERETAIHKKQLNRWQRYGWITRHTAGVDGRQNTYTVESLDALCDKINDRHGGNN